MGRYIVRRLLTAIPTLLVISFVVFALLDLAPNDPTGNLPLTIPPEVRAQIRESLGLGQPFHVRYVKWLRQFLVNEPLNIVESVFDVKIGLCLVYFDRHTARRYLGLQTIFDF
jgi:peptide/nickel transport system permease protein